MVAAIGSPTNRIPSGPKANGVADFNSARPVVRLPVISEATPKPAVTMAAQISIASLVSFIMVPLLESLDSISHLEGVEVKKRRYTSCNEGSLHNVAGDIAAGGAASRSGQLAH